MRKLGEQWIAKQDDGRNHLIQKVDAKEGHYKDLGPVNEEGCLPMPCDSNVYPEVSELIGNVWIAKAQSRTIYMEARGRGKQVCIDAWNRRV